MKNSKLLKALLFLGGAVAIGIGAAILLMPTDFYGTYGIDIGRDASLLNEIRAPGGALVAMGVLVMAGAFFAQFTFASTVIATAAYLSYGLSRLFSMAMDGMPDSGLAGAAAFELVMGVICAFALVRYRVS